MPAEGRMIWSEVWPTPKARPLPCALISMRKTAARHWREREGWNSAWRKARTMGPAGTHTHTESKPTPPRRRQAAATAGLAKLCACAVTYAWSSTTVCPQPPRSCLGRHCALDHWTPITTAACFCSTLISGQWGLQGRAPRFPGVGQHIAAYR